MEDRPGVFKVNRTVMYGLLATVVFCIGLLMRLPWFNGPGQFPWPYRFVLSLEAVAVTGLAFGLYVLVWYFLVWKQEKISLNSLAGLALVFFIMAIAIMSFEPDGVLEFGRNVYSLGSGSYFYHAMNLKDPGRFIEEYPSFVPYLVLHAASHPPGVVISMYGVNEAVKSIPLAKPIGGWLRAHGMVSPEFSDLSDQGLAGLYAVSTVMLVILAFSLSILVFAVNRLIGGHGAKVFALLIGLTPSFFMFAPGVDQSFVVFTAVTLLIMSYSIENKSIWLDLLVGMVVGLASLFSFPLLSLAALPVFVSGARHKNLKEPVMVALRVASGLFLFLAVFFLVTGFDPISSLLAVRDRADYFWQVEADKGHPRSIPYFMVFNPLIFLVHAGIIAGFILFSSPQWWKNQWVWVFVAFIASLTLPGVFRGEVERVWMFLTPVYLLGIADELKERVTLADLAVIAVSLFLQIVVTIATLDVFNPGFAVMPAAVA